MHPSTHWLFLAGRVLFGGFFLSSGVSHFTQLEGLSAHAGAKGVPFSEVAVLLTGALLVIGGLSVLFGYAPKVGLVALVLFLVPVTAMMHAFWKLPEGQERAIEQVNFSKNVALLGATLALAVVPTPWPLSLSQIEKLKLPRARRGATVP